MSAPDPILVTARRREEEASGIPLPLTVLAQDRLMRDNINDLTALTAHVPGFTLARSLRGPPILTLRGVGFNSQNMSATSPVGFYQDEMLLPFPVMSEGVLFDLERVEVVKGPQGTLFGRNSTGGLVNVVAAKPVRQTEGYLALSGGSYRSHGAQGALSGPLGGTLAARLAFSIDRSDKGWQRSVSRGDRLGKTHKLAARLGLSWQPSSATELLVTGNWWRDRSDTPVPQSVEIYPFGLVNLGLAPADWPAGAAMLGLPADFLAQSWRPTSAGQAEWAVDQLPWGGSAGGRNFTPAPLDFQKDNIFHSLAVQGAFRLTDHLTLRSLTGYARFRRDEVTDNSGWAYENAITHSSGQIMSLSQEVRLTGKHARLDWVVGAIYSRDRVNDVDRAWAGTNSILQSLRVIAAQFAAAGGADAAGVEDVLYGFRDYENSTRQTAHSVALFGQGDFRPVPAVGLTFGLRYTRDRTRFAGCSRDLGDNGLAATVNAFYAGLGIASDVPRGGCITFLGDLSAAVASGGAIPAQGVHHDRLTEDNLSGRIAVDWRVNPDATLYASLARGYKSGTFPNIEGNVATQYFPARQERVTTVEAGFKSRAGRRLTLDASVFYSDYRDKQLFGGIPDIVFGSLTRVLNVPRSHIYGLEAAMTARPSPDLLLEASLAHIRTRIDEFTGLDDYGTSRDFAGSAFAYTPQFQMTARAEQAFGLPAGWGARAGLSYRYSSAQQADLAGEPRFRIGPHHVLDASLSLEPEGGRYLLDLFVSNLTNSYYWNAVHLQSDSFARFAAMPRTWNLRVMRRF